MAAIEAAGGVDKNVTNVIDNTISSNPFKDIVGAINPIYAVLVPLCIIYDGSLINSGPSINNQTQAQERAFYFLASAADEQKAGGPTDSTGSEEATAVGAMNAKLGDISQSNPYIGANGGTVNTSTTALSSEASPTGEYTMLNTVLPASAAGLLNTITAPMCQALTNVWFAAGLGVAGIVAGFFTGSASEDAEEGAAEAAEPSILATIKVLAGRVLGPLIPDSIKSAPDILGRLKATLGYLKDTTESVGEVVGATAIAKLIVLAKAGTGGLYNGTEQGADFANEADSGGNIQAGELERQQLFGRPLTCAEITQNDQADQQSIADQNQSQSLANRYLAVSNPNSLLFHMATAVYTETDGSLSNPLSSLLANIMSGPISFGSIFGTLFGVAHADPSCTDEDYGNVQFGWSQTEENLINSSNSYLPLENQAILDYANKNIPDISVNGHELPVENAIAEKYSYCFGYDYNFNGDGNLDPTDHSGDLVPILPVMARPFNRT